jgi:exopolysaccharide biosynthesis polyprenyl glycosylphosphotransferase
MKGSSGFKQALRISDRKILLIAVDVALLILALLLVLAARMGMPLSAATLAARPGWFVLLGLAWTLSAGMLEAYDLRRAARFPAGPLQTAVSVLLADGLYLAIPYYTPYILASRLTLLLFLAATVGLVVLWRTFYALVLVQPSFRHPVLIVGAGPTGHAVLQAIRTHGATEYLPVGFVDDDPGLQGKQVDGLAVVGRHRDLVSAVERTRASEVVVTSNHAEGMGGDLFAALIACHEQGVAITPGHLLIEMLTGQVPVEHAGRDFTVVLPLDRTPPLLYDAVKRASDLLLGAAGLLLAALVAPFAAVALWLEDRGPVFYRQRRVGQGGREFVLLKFRTMVADAEAEGPQWAGIGDARITKAGRILRRLHLDELPQALNVLKGEMSIVGPRPERPEFVAQLQAAIPYYRARLSVRPGITGWAQVNYEYGDSIEDALVKLRYDLYYVRHRSVVLDLQILARTIGHVFRRGGR